MDALKNRGNQLALLSLLLAVGCTMVWFNRAENVALPENRALFIVIWLSAVAPRHHGDRQEGGLARPYRRASRHRDRPVSSLYREYQRTDPAAGRHPGRPDNSELQRTDDRGQLFDSAQLSGNPVLIKFFRAHW